MGDRKSVISRGFGGLELGRQSVGRQSMRDRAMSKQSAFGGTMGGLSRRQTVADNKDFQNMRKLTIGLNELKKEENLNQKLDKIFIEGTTSQKILYEIIGQKSTWFPYFVQVCVTINILMLIAEYTNYFKPSMKRNGNWFALVECFFISVYTIEIGLKLYVFRPKAVFSDGWDLMDFILVIFCFVDLAIGLMSSGSADPGSSTASLAKSGKMLRIVRSARILRLLKTMRMFGKLEQYITTIWTALKDIVHILFLFLSLIMIFSCLACSLFGRILPDRFGNILLTFFTLIQLLTLDDWFEILQEGSVYRYDPNNSNQSSGFNQINITLGLYLVLYIMFMTFIMLNLLIAVLVDNFQLSFEENKYKEATEEDEQNEFLNQLDNMDEEIDDERHDKNEHDKNEHDEEKIDEFENFFNESTGTDLLLRQWYYRLLPAIEKHMFFFNDQMATYERIVDEAINQSDDMYHMTK